MTRQDVHGRIDCSGSATRAVRSSDGKTDGRKSSRAWRRVGAASHPRSLGALDMKTPHSDVHSQVRHRGNRLAQAFGAQFAAVLLAMLASPSNHLPDTYADAGPVVKFSPAAGPRS